MYRLLLRCGCSAWQKLAGRKTGKAALSRSPDLEQVAQLDRKLLEVAGKMRWNRKVRACYALGLGFRAQARFASNA